MRRGSEGGASALVRFYAGAAPDARGRMLAEFWKWDDDRLERVHDYIQWLFPLEEPSLFNDAAPLLTRADRDAFATRPELRENLRRSLRRMLAFYGFALGPEGRVVRAPGFAAHAAHWLAPLNHNFLRLTRILRSLTLLGLEAEAQALLAALEEVYRGGGEAVIGARSLAFWRGAVTAGR
jgi:Opioid growth factor receptor (OGFr) conserved region